MSAIMNHKSCTDWHLTALDRRTETADGDDQVVYSWALSEEKTKRAETADGDDQVVYSWALAKESESKV